MDYMELLGLDQEMVDFMDKTKDDMTEQCRQNIYRINHKCAYEGESFSDHIECFEASKEWIRNRSFTSCYS